MAYVAGDHTQHAQPARPLRPGEPIQENKDSNLGFMHHGRRRPHYLSDSVGCVHLAII